MNSPRDLRPPLSKTELEEIVRDHFLDNPGPMKVAAQGGEGLFYALLSRVSAGLDFPEEWARERSRNALRLWHDSEIRILNKLLWDWIQQGILEPVTEIPYDRDPAIWSSVVLSATGRTRLERNPIPERPDDYLAAMEDKAPELSDVERFYVREGLMAFRARLYPAALVMLGCAAEELIQRIATEAARQVSTSRRDKYERDVKGKITQVWLALEPVLAQHWAAIAGREKAVAHTAFNQLLLSVKISRDDAGHPQATPATLDKARPPFDNFIEAARVGCNVLRHLNGLPTVP